MRICLINPGYALDPSEDNENSISGYSVPHLGLGYIASYLRKNNYYVDLVECMGENISNQSLYRMIETNNYAAVGISIYDDNRINAMRIVQRIRKINPAIFIFLGGYTPTLSYKAVLSHFDADCCIIGEGEVTVLELLQAIENKMNYRKVPGIAYVSSSGNIVLTEKRSLIKDIDILPFPERAFYKNQMLTMISSRGCLCNCIYCSIIAFYEKNNGSHYRYRSAENIFMEIKRLLKQYPDCRLIWYFDDNFLAYTPNNRERLFELCRLLKEENICVPFNITACAKDVIDAQELLVELKSVGLNQVFVGIESFCQRQLDFYNKRTSVEDNIQAIYILNKLNIKINMGFIPMDPFVKAEEIRESFEVLKKCNIKNDAYNIFSIHMHIISVKGTPLRILLDHKGVSENNEKGYRFVNENVNRIYDMLTHWHKIIMPMVSKSDLISVCDAEDNKRHMNLDRLFQKLIQLDIDYVISLCMQAETDYSDWVLKGHLKKWEKKFNDIYSAFEKEMQIYKEVKVRSV